MASEHGGLSTAAPVFTASITAPATVPSPTNIITTQAAAAPARTNSLKRGRPESFQNPTSLTSITNTALVDSPSPKSPRFKGAFSPGFFVPPLTGAAALEDEKRRMEESQKANSTAMSVNPGHKVLSSLIAGGGAAMSKPSEAPIATTTMSEGLSTAANAISIPSPTHYDEKTETSPASVTSLASLGSTAQTATASPVVGTSPAGLTGPTDSDARDSYLRLESTNRQQVQSEEPSNRALTFPGNLLAHSDPPRTTPRGMSLPMPGQQLAPRSPSQKKHKCPYCDTEFTRHHNLKSHLLTHSQEKPYVCQTCTMRFRRLHDLKRHMKLHTGERPHICPKCDRKFARGDALARHSKGQGGCAGRRASMGSFGGDDDYEGSNAGDGDDAGMDGVMYTNGTPYANDSEMTQDDHRRQSLPSIKAQHVPGSHSSGDNYTPQSRTPSTYPPAGPRPGQSSGGLYPPGRDRNDSMSSGTSPSMQSSVLSNQTQGSSLSNLPLTTGVSIFSQPGGMTESPKPLSPSAVQSHQLGHDSSINRQRSPSVTTQFQQQHFGRRPSGRGSSPVMSLPSPHGSSQGPKLPALSNLAPPEQRFTLPTQSPTQPNPPNGSHPSPLPQSGSGPVSPGGAFQLPPSTSIARGGGPQQASGSGDSNNLFAKGNSGVWAYVQDLEDKVKHLSEKIQVMENREQSKESQINRLSEEVLSLRNQLNTQNQSQHQPILRHS